MNKNKNYLIFSIMILCLLVLSAAPAFSVKPGAGNKPQFEYIGYPNNINKDGEDIKIIFCLINRGDIGYFDTADNILVSIPVGGAANDLPGINTYTCEHMGSDWTWMDVSTSPNEIVFMFQPIGPITVNEGDIICFDIYLTINGMEGLAFLTITENLAGTAKPLNTEIGILKTEIPLTSEIDPTITDESIKDGVAWDEVSDRPSGLDDGDDVGITEIPAAVMEEGENVSLLNNDAGYLSSVPSNVMVEGENISLLTNDAGYMTSVPVTVMEEGENVSLLNNNAGYL